MINPQTINPLELPSISLEMRSQLPTTPSIYFAIDSQGVIQYIGRSINPRQRWVDHHRFEQLDEIGQVKIAWLPVSEEDLLDEIEEALIEYFNPVLNGTVFRSSARKISKNEGKPSSMYCRLAVLMAEKNPQLSQRQLARETGLDITTINRLYTNNFSRVDINTIEVLCNYFEKNVGDLLEMRFPEDIPKRQIRSRKKAETLVESVSEEGQQSTDNEELKDTQVAA